MRNRRRKSNSKLSGFTLTELMIVVTITGILAALAIPQLQRYRLRARAWQAEEFLQSIGLREEAYRAEFGRYLATNASGCALPLAQPNTIKAACFNPNGDSVKGRDVAFDSSAPLWQQLGAAPAGTVYFGFAVAAGPPNALPTDVARNMNPDFWWVAQATGDIDADGVYAVFELTSQSRRVWVSSNNGYD